MKTLNTVYLNGEFMAANEAKISIFDRGFIFGDGVYEVMPVVGSKIVDMEPFWERFNKSMLSCELKLPFSKEELLEILNLLIAKNELKEGGIYMQLTRGVAPRDFVYTNTAPTLMAYAFEASICDNDLANTGVKLVSVPDIRWKRRDIKSISLLGQCMSKNEAKKAGAFEAVMVENGLVTEGSSSNISIIKNGELITKPVSNEILAGIRRGNILELAKFLNLKITQRAFSLEELYEADEAFISSATLIIIPVVEVDNRQINGKEIGPFYKRLRALYLDKLKKEAGI